MMLFSDRGQFRGRSPITTQRKMRGLPKSMNRKTIARTAAIPNCHRDSISHISSRCSARDPANRHMHSAE
jgi:hypothetical protein